MSKWEGRLLMLVPSGWRSFIEVGSQRVLPCCCREVVDGTDG